MKFGFVQTIKSVREAGELARMAEDAGWDGFFCPEAVWHVDPWISLTAAAMCTRTICLGTMICQLPRHRPWKLASESATLDNLSGGRVILAVGVGVPYYGYQSFKDETLDKRVRGELMDEGIDLLTLLYLGKPFKFEGKHYHVDLTVMDEQYYPPPPVQRPRIPIWVVGVWPRRKSMQRVLRCDGVLINKMDPDGKMVEYTPADLAQVKAYVEANRALTTAFDFIADGKTTGLDRAQEVEKLAPWVEAGATWWIEAAYGEPEESVLARLRQGPPRIN